MGIHDYGPGFLAGDFGCLRTGLPDATTSWPTHAAITLRMGEMSRG